MRTLPALLGLLLLATPALAHDLFLKLESWFLAPHTDATVDLFNGTFERSDNTIDRDRMLDVSIVGPVDGVVHPDAAGWRDVGQRTRLSFRTGDPGTYTLGVSTRARAIELDAEAFRNYLEHDGVVDILARRREQGRMEESARELYAKHVKAIVQVGDARSPGALARLGYPVEIVPLSNPYDLAPGAPLPVAVLRDGKPLADQVVHASRAGHHVHDADGRHVESFSGRTDGNGRVDVPLPDPGRWYVRLIHMEESAADDLDYVSNWATLTFERRWSTGSSGGAGGWPLWAYGAAAAAVFAALLQLRRRRVAA